MAIVLVTGSAGAVGQPVCQELGRRGYTVRGLDRVPTPGVDEQVVGDIANTDVVQQAIQGADALIHLAAQPVDADFSVLLGPNVIGLYNVMNAAREAALRRVVLASSIQVLWRAHRKSRPARVDEAAPGNHYALTKLWAEEMGAMYSRRYDLSVIAVRIAWLVRNPDEAAHMQRCQRFELYLSANDAGRLFACAVEAEGIDFAVVYAASVDGARAFDLEPARRLLGYTPRDRWPDGLGFDPPAETQS
jgi:uronate dehydrogenase